MDQLPVERRKRQIELVGILKCHRHATASWRRRGRIKLHVVLHANLRLSGRNRRAGDGASSAAIETAGTKGWRGGRDLVGIEAGSDQRLLNNVSDRVLRKLSIAARGAGLRRGRASSLARSMIDGCI